LDAWIVETHRKKRTSEVRVMRILSQENWIAPEQRENQNKYLLLVSKLKVRVRLTFSAMAFYYHLVI